MNWRRRYWPSTFLQSRNGLRSIRHAGGLHNEKIADLRTRSQGLCSAISGLSAPTTVRRPLPNGFRKRQSSNLMYALERSVRTDRAVAEPVVQSDLRGVNTGKLVIKAELPASTVAPVAVNAEPQS
jgi:hypothetical protein